MTGPLRTVIADDSATFRLLLSEMLRADGGFEVVGEARNGAEAVDLVQQHRPDLVVMDVRMPVMDGFDATRRIMTEVPTPVVIITAQSSGDVRSSLDALAAGALTLLAKPPGPGASDWDRERHRFLRTLRNMAGVKVVRRWPPAEAAQRSPPWPPTPPHPVRGTPAVRGTAPAVRGTAPATAPAGTAPAVRGTPGGACEVVGIAASTGGPAALRALLSSLSAEFPCPILIVQHMAAGFEGGLAEWLDRSSRLSVRIAQDGEPLVAGSVYVAPGDRHLGVGLTRRIALSEAPPIEGFRPSATHLFETLSAVYGASTVVLVLTGMGHDGVAGLAAVRERGGHVVAQDEESSVVYGMPGAAAQAGLVDEQLSLDKVASWLAAFVDRER